MNIVLAADHAGYRLKEELKPFLLQQVSEVMDLGVNASTDVADYPDIAQLVADYILDGRAQRAVVICGSGIGATMACNKLAGIYAGLCHDTYTARQGVEHDNMNVICLGARVIGIEVAREIVQAFLSATFAGEERHLRRIAKMQALEERTTSTPR